MYKLSSRGQLNVKAIMPHIPKSAREGLENDEVINFATAENWVLRDRITNLCRQALVQTLEPKHLSWPSGFFGMPKLLDAIARFGNDVLKPHQPITPEEITIVPGAAGGAMSLLWNICEAGDSILVPTPYWLRARVSLIGVEVPRLQDSMSIGMLDALERAFSASDKPVKALLISNPHNPIGRPWTRQMMEEMYRFCQKKQIHFISDEIFASVAFESPDFPDATPFTSVLELDAEALDCDAWRAHMIWSPSKLFGMSGLRLGAIITRAGTEFRDGLALSAPLEVSAVSSILILHILNSEDRSDLIERSSQLLCEHYRILTSALNELCIPYMPCNATLSLMAHIVPEASSWDEEDAIITALDDIGILVGSGRSYHVKEMGWARITFAIQRDKLLEGVEKMGKVLGKRAADRSADL